MQLLNWQQQLQQVVLTGEDNTDLLLRHGSIAREDQLAIYSNAYHLRLTEALRSNYSMLHRLLGDDDFNILARQYIVAQPSTNPSIRWFGDRFSEFITETAPFNAVPAIAELASFEWALRHTIDAADAEILTMDDLQNIPPEQWGRLTCNLHPSLTMLALEWNTPQIWRALTDDNEPPEPCKTPNLWLIYRQPNRVSHWRSAEKNEVSALNLWAKGGSFEDICGDLLQQAGRDKNLCKDLPKDLQKDTQKDPQNIAMLAATFLKTWVQQGLLVHR